MRKITDQVDEEMEYGVVAPAWTTVAQIEKALTPQECAGLLSGIARFRLDCPDRKFVDSLHADPYYQCWYYCISVVGRRA